MPWFPTFDKTVGQNVLATYSRSMPSLPTDPSERATDTFTGGDRPRIHFTVESGWTNDPHGITHHDGQYHLFHQYVPDRTVWAPHCHWGHAVGPDLLHWRTRPVALAPGEGDDGIWTGSLAVADDGPVILYTATDAHDFALGRVRLARPTDSGWDTWVKGDVVVRAPDDLDVVVFRDPFVRREGAGWRMFVGAGTSSGEALAITYTSADLTNWQYDGIAARRSSREHEPVWMGALWECPQVIEVDGRSVLISSVWDADVLYYAGYGIGDYRDGRFKAQDWGRISFGGSYYAPSFFRDDQGRPCLMFWMRGVQDQQAGWSGALSVPHLLAIRDGKLVVLPHPAWAAAPGRPADLDAVGEAAVRIAWEPDTPGDRIAFEPATALSWDGTQVLLERVGDQTWDAPHSGGRVDIVLDGPVVEAVTTAGVLGGPMVPATSVRVHGGRAQGWVLD